MSEAQVAAMLAREKVVLDHRVRGWSFYRIEKELRIANPGEVWRRAIERDENIGYKRAEAIRLEEARLDALQDGIWDKALGGDARAVEVCLKLLERRARMLGLDFADMISGRLVEVEQAKVRVMAAALVKALNAADVGPDARRAAVSSFFAELRAADVKENPLALPVRSVLDGPAAQGLADEDRDLL
jgi:hypothetical protein